MDNSIAIESTLNESDPNVGYRDDSKYLTLADLTLNDVLTQLSVSTAPEVAAIATDLYGMKWDHGDLVTDTVEFSFQMPWTFAELKDDLEVVIVARKLNTENADLALQAQIDWFQPGVASNPKVAAAGTPPTLSTAAGAIKALTTPARATLVAVDAAATNADLVGFATYRLDIGARLRAEGKRIYAGDIVRIRIGPHETVGATDTDLEAFPPILRLRRHASLKKRSSRFD